MLAVVPNKRRRPSSSNRWASRTLSQLPSPLSVTASARLKYSRTARSAATATAPTSVASVCATRAGWARTASALRGTITPRSKTVAADPQDTKVLSPLSAAAVATACAASACATAATLGKSGGSCVSVMTSTACATKESCAQVRLQELKGLAFVSSSSSTIGAESVVISWEDYYEKLTLLSFTSLINVIPSKTYLECCSLALE